MAEISLSYFGAKYYLVSNLSLSTTDTTLSSADELLDILSCDVGAITKDITTKRTLNGNGWEAVTPLGQSISEGSIGLLRKGTGDVYQATGGTSTYARLRDWVNAAISEGGATSEKSLVELIPRGNGAYEGTVYTVVPTSFTPGVRDTENGQEYSVGIKAYGAPVPVVVTVNGTTISIKKYSAPAQTPAAEEPAAEGGN